MLNVVLPFLLFGVRPSATILGCPDHGQPKSAWKFKPFMVMLIQSQRKVFTTKTDVKRFSTVLKNIRRPVQTNKQKMLESGSKKWLAVVSGIIIFSLPMGHGSQEGLFSEEERWEQSKGEALTSSCSQENLSKRHSNTWEPSHTCLLKPYY